MPRISRKKIEKAVRKSLTDTDIRSVKQYKKGHINTMYEISLAKSKKPLILRLYNEAWKAKKESFVYRCIKSHVDIPIPEILAVDDTKKILPNAYMLMSKIDGIEIDKNYRKYKNKSIFRKAGELLAKIHSIKFHHYGWIMDNEIRPAFPRWHDFVWHDFYTKMCNIKTIRSLKPLLPQIEGMLGRYSPLLNTKQLPCLLHKDYHCSHILTKKDRITGIIDVEWAIAGHNENDFMKMELWAFQKRKKARQEFFRGYRKNGHISSDYKDRKKLYELWHWVSMINISKETKNKDWLDHNISKLKKFLK